MIKLFTIITLILQTFFTGKCNAQQSNLDIRESDKPSQFVDGEGFIGGKQEYDNYILKNRTLPQTNGNGYVLIDVYINSSGIGIRYDIGDFTLHDCPACLKEAERLIKNIKRWQRPKITIKHSGKSVIIPKFYSVRVYF